MTTSRKGKRSYGSGSIIQIGDTWFGKWRVGERQVKRRLGPVRPVGSKEGLTRSQAEAALRRLIGEVRSSRRRSAPRSLTPRSATSTTSSM
jgi:hypothetical protein